MAKASETKQTVPAEGDKDLKGKAKEPENSPDEIEELKSQVNGLRQMMEQALAAMAKAADSKTKEVKPAEEAETLGAAMDSDEGTVWEELVPVRTPRRGKGQEKSIVISVNDRNVQVPLDGKVYYLRKPHAEIFEQSMEAEIAAEEFAESVPNEAAPASYEQLISEMADLKRRLKDMGINV